MKSSILIIIILIVSFIGLAGYIGYTLTQYKKCVDSDLQIFGGYDNSGFDLQVPSICKDVYGDHVEICYAENSTQILREYRCENNKCIPQSVDCSKEGYTNCNNGRCEGKLSE